MFIPQPAGPRRPAGALRIRRGTRSRAAREGGITKLSGIDPEGASPYILRVLRYPLVVVVLLSSAVFGSAQRPASPPPPPATPAQDMVRLQFPNSDVADVLREYETLTGKRVITDN